MSSKTEIEASISPYKEFFKSAVAISFDYESSAVSRKPSFYTGLKRRLKKIYYSFKNTTKDLSSIYGRGYANRFGAATILKIFQKYDLHGTWFSTGHVLLKDNTQRNAFRINQILPYMKPEAGFSPSLCWRNSTPTFSQEPFKDFRKFPFWYLGDQAEELKANGEDIQCHTFSHPFVALESIENIGIDMEDWQSVAISNGYNTANILAFPYLGDAYRHYYTLDLKAHPSLKIKGQPFKDIPISDGIIQKLHQNGIELLTRCISRLKDSCRAGFVPYENSSLYYMSDMNFQPRISDLTQVKKYLGELVDGGCALNIWMHPNNVFTLKEKEKFENLMKFLKIESNKKRIWVTTILEMWRHFKGTKACRVEVKSKGYGTYEANVHNGNQFEMKQVGIVINPSQISLVHPDNNISIENNRISIGRLASNQNYQFKFCFGG
jgi:peptidoglycan/xylan/chitin deacetylase (PgdA/CDA1 family)